MSGTNQMGVLAALTPGLYLIENLVFKQKTVGLDGYCFRNCAFVDCVLSTSTGNFALEQCFFGARWFVNFDGTARNIVKMTRVLDWTEPNPLLTPTIDKSGGVTIK